MWPGSLHDRPRIEELWRIRLVEARLNYSRTVAESQAIGINFRSHELPPPDGGASVINALKAERVARDEYMRVLRIFTDLMVHGKKP